MADDKKNALPEGESAPKSSKFKRFMIFFLIFLVLAAAGGGGAYWWFYLRTPAEASQEENADQAASSATTESESSSSYVGEDGTPRLERQSDLPRSTGQVLPLPPFVVNLADPTGTRYLRLGMEVEVNQDVRDLIESERAKIRDAVIVLLAGKTFGDVSSADGKIQLKAEVAARLNQILGGSYVVRVYFTEFVVE